MKLLYKPDGQDCPSYVLEKRVNWSDAIAESFPAPRDDEPTSLRQDIADELGDHLHCALHRQLITTPDPDQAREKVLDRFGDPHKIARQLWFDALKEKIMSQRIMLVLTVVMTIACLAAMGMTWLAVEYGRASNLALAEQSRAANEALLAQMAKLSATPAIPPSLEWNPVKVRLVTPDLQAPIPAGFKVSLRGNVLDTSKSTSIKGTLDANGVADFGLVRSGHHDLTVEAPWGEFHERTLDVRPGQSRTEDVVCPPAAPADAEITFSANWPDDLRDKHLWLVCDFTQIPREFNKASWTTFRRIVPNPSDEQMLVMTPAATVMYFNVRDYGGNRALFQPTYSYPQDSPLGQLGLHGDPRSPPPPTSGYHFGVKNLPTTLNVHWPAVGYRLQALLVATDHEEDLPVGGIRKLKVISGTMIEERGRFVGSASVRPVGRFLKLNLKEQPPFEAVAGQVNQWKIALPDELLKIVREQLANEK